MSRRKGQSKKYSKLNNSVPNKQRKPKYIHGEQTKIFAERKKHNDDHQKLYDIKNQEYLQIIQWNIKGKFNSNIIFKFGQMIGTIAIGKA